MVGNPYGNLPWKEHGAKTQKSAPDKLLSAIRDGKVTQEEARKRLQQMTPEEQNEFARRWNGFKGGNWDGGGPPAGMPGNRGSGKGNVGGGSGRWSDWSQALGLEPAPFEYGTWVPSGAADPMWGWAYGNGSAQVQHAFDEGTRMGHWIDRCHGYEGQGTLELVAVGSAVVAAPAAIEAAAPYVKAAWARALPHLWGAAHKATVAATTAGAAGREVLNRAPVYARRAQDFMETTRTGQVLKGAIPSAAGAPPTMPGSYWEFGGQIFGTAANSSAPAAMDASERAWDRLTGED